MNDPTERISNTAIVDSKNIKIEINNLIWENANNDMTLQEAEILAVAILKLFDEANSKFV